MAQSTTPCQLLTASLNNPPLGCQQGRAYTSQERPALTQVDSLKFLYPIRPDSIVTQPFAAHLQRAWANGWQNYNRGIDWAVATGTRIV
jgi:hypothetical protein